MRLLLVEDEKDLALALSVILKKNHYTVDVVHDGQSAEDYALACDYDAIILDLMLPQKDGLSVLRELRERGKSTPVMLLTARGEKDDRVLGFDQGADDYLPKPFAVDELLARLRALLRRKNSVYAPQLRFGDLLLDSGSGQLLCRENATLLSGREFQVMEMLLQAAGQRITPERMLDRIWGFDSETEIGAVWVHISNLRKKLKALGSAVSIRASRGMGYVLEERHDSKA